MARRIAILNTNTDRSPFARQFPDDGHKVIEGLRPLRPDWIYDVWDAAAGQLPGDLQAYQGWVLTGSVASVNDDAPWIQELAACVRRLDAERRPLVGLCFGHQLVAQALGGRVGPSPQGWRVGTATTNWTSPAPWMQPAQASSRLFAVHQEQVLEPPPAARVLGGDDFAPIGALAVGRHIFTTQYHPELTRPFLRALFDAHGATWSAELLAGAREAIEQPVDAELFFRWMAQFLEAP